MNQVDRMANAISTGLGIHKKELFHSYIRGALRMLAEELGISRPEYSIQDRMGKYHDIGCIEFHSDKLDIVIDADETSHIIAHCQLGSHQVDLDAGSIRKPEIFIHQMNDAGLSLEAL